MNAKLDGYRLVCTYRYQLANGYYFFGKHRFERLPNRPDLRPKEFRYVTPSTGRWAKPDGADNLLYGLPQLLAGIKAGKTIHWAEGEKDRDALVRAGAVATSHHQGAGRVTQAQADWLTDAKEVVLWVDKDVDRWEVGAYDAVLRHNLLIDAGVPAKRIRFVRALGTGRKDAFDHLQRYSIERAVAVDKFRLADVAAGYAPVQRRLIGY